MPPKLRKVFDENLYDPANEPDITYPYLFAQVKGQEWRTDSLVNVLLKKHFKNQPDGIPGNDDTGYHVGLGPYFSMMGLYPDCPGIPRYTLTAPTFDRITLHLDPRYYKHDTLVIECERPSAEAIYVDHVEVNGKRLKGPLYLSRRFGQCRHPPVRPHPRRRNNRNQSFFIKRNGTVSSLEPAPFLFQVISTTVGAVTLLYLTPTRWSKAVWS